MTDKQLESAARYYCEVNLIDPDKKVSHGAEPDENGCSIGICLYSPMWKIVSNDIKKHWLIHESMRFSGVVVPVAV